MGQTHTHTHTVYDDLISLLSSTFLFYKESTLNRIIHVIFEVWMKITKNAIFKINHLQLIEYTAVYVFKSAGHCSHKIEFKFYH